MHQETLPFDAAIRRVAELVAPSPPTTVIAVSGGTQSGKTTFARTLARRLRGLGRTVATLELDDFFLDLEDPRLPRDGSGRAIYDVPEAYHREEFRDAASTLASGQPVWVPIYRKGENRRTGMRLLRPSDARIAEGLFAGTFLAGLPVPLIEVFMDTPVLTCRKRRIETDVRLYGVSPEKVGDAFDERILPFWNDHIMPQRATARFIVTPNPPPEGGEPC